MKTDEIKLKVYPGELPSDDRIAEGFLYMSLKYRTAVHRCACGCGAKVVTPLKPSGWKISVVGNKPTLTPSIGNFQLPCKSHYFIREGMIVWA